MSKMPRSLIVSALRTVETVPLPDALLRLAISTFVGMRATSPAPSSGRDRAFAEAMDRESIARHADAANAQHYELPAEFFGLALGPHRKYSCCQFDTGRETLAEAEAKALATTAARAGLADGQRILELGCGWGSLTLWMAARYPKARVTAVSNSASQRRHIEATARDRGLANLEVITCDMNRFDPPGTFDRVVSVEMFEHMTNWRALLTRIGAALEPDGRMFMHIFAHRADAYRFDHTDPTDWIGQHFFTGGIMPSEGLIRQFDDLLEVEEAWRWSGTHYARTATLWLENFDRHEREIRAVMEAVYGADARLWLRRWRLFFLATEGLFGYRGGEDWGVMHYRLRPAR